MPGNVTTQHYGIAKYGPQGTGEPMGVYSVYNPAMDTIDKILFDHKGLIDALEGRMDDAESRLDGHDTDIAEIRNSLSKLDQRVTKNETDIDNLEGRVTTNETNISKLDKRVTKNETDIDNLEGRVTTNETNISKLGDRLTTVEGDVSEIKQDIAQIKNQLTQLGEQITNLENGLDADTDHLWAAIQAIVNHVTQGGTVNQDNGSISWGATGTIAVGNINITSGAGYIRCHAATDQTNDLRARV